MGTRRSLGGMSSIEFDVRPLPGRRLEADFMSVMPVVDGDDLAVTVARFESTMNFTPPGGYEGIVPAFFSFGDLASYYVGRPEPEYWIGVGKIALLGCDCGEVACWPLYAAVRVEDDEVVWSEFAQPHRPDRDYSKFGSIRFARDTYEEAAQRAVSLVEASV